MPDELDISAQWKLFVDFYTDTSNETTRGNATQAAIAAGYSKAVATKRGYAILQDPRVQKIIKQLSDVQESALTTGDLSLRELLSDAMIAGQLNKLRQKDPDKFIRAVATIKKANTEMEEELSGLSIAELIRRGREVSRETDKNIDRIEEAIREGKM